MFEFKEISLEEAKNLGKNQINRLCAKSHINKIKKDIKNWDLIPPIIVNKTTNNIIDGQHRLEVFKLLINEEILFKNTKLKVIYVDIPKECEMEAIINANTHSKNWSLNDYIEAYIQNGEKSYEILKEWCLQHPLCENKGKPKYRYGAAFFMGKNASKDLKSGSFKIMFDMQYIETKYKYVSELIELYNLPTNAFLETLIIKVQFINSIEDFSKFKDTLEKANDKIQFIKDCI